MKYIIILLVSASWCVTATAQPGTTPLTIGKSLDNFKNEYPQEKVFLQTDKAQYFAGETIWFKAWCTADGLPSYLSRILYVTVADKAGKVVTKKMYRLDSLSSASGDIDIPSEMASGNYSISAYTLWMLNFPDFVFQKNIFIYNADYKPTTAKTVQPKLFFTIFPEGGDLVAGLKNRIAFKATDENGFPVDVNGWITDTKNNRITQFAAEHDGLGSFEMEPNAGVQYTANIPFGDGSVLQFPIVAAKEDGIILRVENNNPNRIFIIVDRTEKNKDRYNKLKLFAQMHFQKVFSSDINFDEGENAASISKKTLPPGIMQVTIFDENNHPLAERIIFVENYNIEQPVINFDTLNLKPKSKNVVSFTLANLPATLSLLVTNGVLDNDTYKTESIASSLLATSDLKGYIHNPGYYFRDKTPTTLHHLDLLLMTQGWRRFQWKQLLANDYSALLYPVESSITILGKVTKSDRSEIVKDGKVSFIIKGEDSTTILADAKLTDKGEFLLNDLNFRKQAKVAYQGTNNKKENLVVDVKIKPSFIDTLKLSRFRSSVNMDTLDINNRKSALANYLFSKYAVLDTGKLSRINYLGNVMVKAKRLNKADSLNNEYATGAFVMGKGILPDDYQHYHSIWQMLAAAVPGIRIEGDPFDPTVSFSRFEGLDNVFGGSSASEDQPNEFGNLETTGITYFLNEMNVSKDLVNTLNKDDVALIKVYKNEGAAIGAPRGAIAFYTKKGMTASANVYDKTFNTITKEGYAVVKEFFSPDYERNPTISAGETDKRFTLYWSGKLKPGANGKYVFHFFNNEVSNRYKLVIQGLAKDGSIILYEKIIQ